MNEISKETQADLCISALVAEIKSDIESISDNPSLYDEHNFSARADAIDFLEFHVIDRLESLLDEAGSPFQQFKLDAQVVKYQLEKINDELFRRVRKAIGAGSYRGIEFLNLLKEYFGDELYSTDEAEPGYDNLDLFVNGLLLQTPVPEPGLDRLPEMVFYQQTPARIIFELIDQLDVQATDVFYDLGSGLGHVPILVNLLTGINTKGVEFEPAYCDYAKSCADKLNLADVHFINADARTAGYTDGTIFFMYTPFEGAMLDEVLERLREISTRKIITIFSYGPCSRHIGKEEWLTGSNAGDIDIYKMAMFRSS